MVFEEGNDECGGLISGYSIAMMTAYKEMGENGNRILRRGANL